MSIYLHRNMDHATGRARSCVRASVRACDTSHVRVSAYLVRPSIKIRTLHARIQRPHTRFSTRWTSGGDGSGGEVHMIDVWNGVGGAWMEGALARITSGRNLLCLYLDVTLAAVQTVLRQDKGTVQGSHSSGALCVAGRRCWAPRRRRPRRLRRGTVRAGQARVFRVEAVMQLWNRGCGQQRAYET